MLASKPAPLQAGGPENIVFAEHFSSKLVTRKSRKHVDFSLFRIKVFRPHQKEIFGNDRSPPDILGSAILERPTDTAHGNNWHIGNVEDIGSEGIYFALGRASRSRVPVLDPKSGNFLETEFESAPYTHVLVDVPREIAAIAHKSSLSPDVAAVARSLVRLLSLTSVAAAERVTFEASPVSRPDEFIRALSEAFSISSFTVYFTRPNPLDVDGDFLEPMERLTQEANATDGSTTIRGSALDSEPLTQLTRSAAATGDNATARIRTGPNAISVKRSLRGDTAKVTQDALDTREERQSLLERIRTVYDTIRGGRRNSA